MNVFIVYLLIQSLANFLSAAAQLRGPETHIRKAKTGRDGPRALTVLTKKPTRKPTALATTRRPTHRPTIRPTGRPTRRPTRRPTETPTRRPTGTPTRRPLYLPPAVVNPTPTSGAKTCPSSVSDFYQQQAGSSPYIVACRTNYDCRNFKQDIKPGSKPCCLYPYCLCGSDNPGATSSVSCLNA